MQRRIVLLLIAGVVCLPFVAWALYVEHRKASAFDSGAFTNVRTRIELPCPAMAGELHSIA
jgi:hypothetical protein